MHKLFLAQIALVLLLACVWGVADHAIVPSVLYGGVACVLPNFYFAHRFFSKRHQRRPGQILVTFYVGEFAKMLISAALIILSIRFLGALLLPTVAGYFVANMA